MTLKRIKKGFLIKWDYTPIYDRLEEIDKEAVRPTRELLLDPDNEYAQTKLQILETEAASLRAQLRGE